MDGSKTATWSNDGMRLTVDGETNINIDNKNIEEVYWDGVKQPQTSKQWAINVKPETAPRDHKLVIKYNINGTKYTSEEIMVSMLAKIDPPTPSKQENLSDVIKFGDENNLGNIVDKNDSTIFSAITQKNARIVDFLQITIEKKDNNKATLKARDDSKSYKGSVDVTYNVVPATVVDLKIELKPTAGTTQPDSDYLSQLDSSKMTNPVNTFYYASSESVITMVKLTESSVITGVVYGCDEQWNKTSQSSNIDPTNGIKLDGGQLGARNGKYLIELENELKQKNIIYLQIAPKQTKEHYFYTTNGKNFEIWANDNGYDNIRGYGASQLNKLFELSKTWKQSLAHLDLKLDNFVVDNIKNFTQNEIDNYKTKLLANVKEQVEKYIPNVVENTDYVISVDNLVAGDWTTSKDVKVQAVDGSTKLLSFTVKTIPVQQKEQAIPLTPDNIKKGGLTGWAIFGIVVGSIAGLVLLGWLFKRFVINPFILKPIREKKEKAFVAKTEKDIAQMKKDDEEWEAKQKGDK
ncbi:adhesin [Spiroplasma poulsonii]|uniref:adhesin n=1 Tax=Spiroplasma poulsonii TaxID=2138 RepID=UPI001F4D01D7|nr:adhesin [Spiroplasma poulsonii]UNF61946.1 adhesin [Spiroplasma poulsonii]